MKRSTRSSVGVSFGSKTIPSRNTPFDVYIEGHWYTPMSPVLDLTPYTKLLLHMNGVDGSTTFIDAMGLHSPVAVNGAIISTENGWCYPGDVAALISGLGSRIEVPLSTDFDFGGGNFTIEGWVYPDYTASGITQNQGIINRGDDLTSMYITYNSSDNIGNPYCISYYDQQLGTIHGTTPIGSIDGGNDWAHFAVTRSENTVRLFVNGVLEGTILLEPDTVILPYTYGKVCLGASEFGGYTPNMSLDEVRILKGYALYTSSFTPTSRCSPFPPADPA